MVEITIGNGVSLNMGSRSLTQYQLNPTVGSLDLSLVANVQDLLAGDYTGPDLSPGEVTAVTDSGVIFTTFGYFNPSDFANATTTGFEMLSPGEPPTLIFSMTFPELDAYPYIQAFISGDWASLDAVVDEYVANLAGQPLTIHDGSLGNRINGDTGSDLLYGNGGNDVLGGLAGNDTMDGGVGNDIVKGGVGADVLKGLGGTDRLYGGAGNDKLTGGAGNDKFVFDTALNGTKDTILDFTTGDKIWLDNDIFTALGTQTTTTNLSPGAFCAGANALEANDRIIYNASTGALYYDSDGSGAAAQVQFAIVGTNTHPALLNTDIQIIA